MIRLVPAAAIAVLLIPSAATAQPAVFTIGSAAADVHKSPSVGSPVIGQAPRGRALEVTREVGDWLRVSWPEVPDGVGFVRRSLGSLSRNAVSASNAPFASAQSPIAPSSSAMTTRSEIDSVQRSVPSPAEPRSSSDYVLPPSHRIGLGGLMNGSTIGFGASGRVWSRRRFGVQVELSRFSSTSPSALGRMSSIHFAPSVIYSLRSHVNDSFWARPYFGGGAKLLRSTLTIGSAGEWLAENRKSWQVFGGSELTVPNAPRFALSADVRYDSARTPFAGFDLGGFGFTVAGHWYVK